MAAQTNAQKVDTRQAAVRQWYYVNVIGNSLLTSLLSDPDNEARRGVLRWCQNHVRVAAHQGGKLLVPEANWDEIQEQLLYAPTLIASKIRGGDWPEVLGGLKSRYHVVNDTVSNRWRLMESEIITTKLAVYNGEIYDFLGGYGGIKGGGFAVPESKEEE